jgi:rRNA maturation endonuclease Nob1
MKIVFDDPVEPAFGIRVSGQHYRAMRLVNYTTKLGAVIDMMEWVSLCWDCDRVFHPMSKPNEAPQSRRCKFCASPGKKAKRKMA